MEWRPDAQASDGSEKRSCEVLYGYAWDVPTNEGRRLLQAAERDALSSQISQIRMPAKQVHERL